jgi:hypothetical protein
MNKESLLKEIATNGYNVGFGAKKNFASYDILIKLPSWVGFVSLSIGILQLGYDSLGGNKELSAFLIIISVAIMYLNSFNAKIDDFNEEGIRLTKLFNSLRLLYFKVKDSDKENYNTDSIELKEILTEYYSKSITKQVFMSQWYAHYKFFYEMQIVWVDEQLKFKFIKDKVPASLKIIVSITIIVTIIYAIYEYIRNI